MARVWLACQTIEVLIDEVKPLFVIVCPICDFFYGVEHFSECELVIETRPSLGTIIYITKLCHTIFLIFSGPDRKVPHLSKGRLRNRIRHNVTVSSFYVKFGRKNYFWSAKLLPKTWVEPRRRMLRRKANIMHFFLNL